MDHQGEYIAYRYEPKDLSSIHVYTTKWEYINVAERTLRTAWNDEEAYHEIKKIEKKRKQAIKSEREAAENLIEVEFGYQKQEPSGEHPDTPAKTFRILRTPFDGIQKSIDQKEEETHSHAVAGGESFRERYMEDARRRLEERERKREEAQRPGRFFKLTIPGGN